jgi:5'-nucleotidase
LVTNDDGIYAPGLKILEKIARRLTDDVWTVAPEVEQSGASHSLTSRRPLRLRQDSRKRYAVDGTPTDCVMLGVRNLLKDRWPDLVLSGINPGANLADDVTYSGTVSAAMEGALLGVPSIAFSQVVSGGRAVKWSTAEQWAGPVISKLLAAGWPKNVLINVNFPEVPAAQVVGIALARQGKRLPGEAFAERLDPRGQPYFWLAPQRAGDLGQRGSDLEAVSQGKIAVTPLTIDLTSGTTLKRLASAIG